MEDVEYNGYLIVKARYYEPWETWVSKTCSYTTTHSCGENCTYTVTHYYDCSYCDDHSAKYEATLSNGEKIYITQEKYLELESKWSASRIFVELDRTIRYHGSCGKDGDAYDIYWDRKIITSEAYVKEVEFKNPVKISHSAFKFPEITKEEADSLGLYHYPKIGETRQQALLSKSFIFPDTTHLKFEYLNGYLGPINKVKVFTLLFKDKPIDISFKQEQYWEGGNQNEVVVCIGVDSTLHYNWIRVFSWCDNKRICVDLREDLMSLKGFNTDAMLYYYYKDINSYYKYKSFKDFNYLKFEPTNNQLIVVLFIVLIITVLTIWFSIVNEVDPD
jgi:hypothetical protein